MKIHLQAEILMTWFLLFGMFTDSHSVLVSGVVDSIGRYKAITEKLQESSQTPKPTQEELVRAHLRFDVKAAQPKSLEEYLSKLPGSNLTIGHHNNSAKNHQPDSKVVVVARIGDYDNQTETTVEWRDVSIPKVTTRNDILLNSKKNQSKEEFENNFDYFLQKDDGQRYANDYQDLLYTFKDFVNLGSNPNIKEKLFKESAEQNNGRTFNVTYVMPIPKSTKYFEIKMSNLTETQYNEINALLQEHMRKSLNSTLTKTNKKEIMYVDIEDRKNLVSSRDLTSSSSFPNLTTQNTFEKNWPNNPEDAMAYFKRMFTEEGYNEFLDKVKSKSNLNQTFPSKNTAPLMKNNGFHAEIATDYVHKEGEEQENTFSSFNKEGTNPFDLNDSSAKIASIVLNSSDQTSNPNIADSIVATATTVLSPIYTRRNATKLYQQSIFNKPNMYNPNSTQNRRTNEFNFDHEGTLNSSLPPKPIWDEKILNEDYNVGITGGQSPQTTTDIQHADLTQQILSSNTFKKDMIDYSEFYKNTKLRNSTTLQSNSGEFPTIIEPLSGTSNIPKSENALEIMKAANWIVGMEKRLQEEKRQENERHMNYIKKHLGRDDDSSITRDDGNVMKINKKENILEKLKDLMMQHLKSMNFNTQEVGNNTLSVETIKNATNIFELMESSTQFVKANLQIKIETETKEPTRFVKKIVDTQVEKCKQIFNSSLFSKAGKKIPDQLKKNSHRKFPAFTNCMNLRLKRCIIGFSMWLEKGKFYTRPQFKLDRAYENYEIERNLYCLRTYNATSLDSNPRGVRVKPGSNVNRKYRMRRMRSERNKGRVVRSKIIDEESKNGFVFRKDLSRNEYNKNNQERGQAQLRTT